MEGYFTYDRVPVKWTVNEDGEADEDGRQLWVLHVRATDFSVLRRYRGMISYAHADHEARQIAPTLVELVRA